ncbi:cytochrome c3 family protein [SCandidatus Aminicenantes bacterium Aminicenantia_JdfR_composite]|jgi:nitrate/TMAO reductase-like tetraheme cytochrome c subunit|nr:cytochrome c3 family protein [SCandidatus Aminicenantes bacterium Aminicenantia_JdfR_composite]
MNKKKKKRIIFLLSFVFLILLLLGGAAEYTSHSKFCSTCHYMKPFYRSWQTSKHNNVECATCHYPPGFKSKLNSKILGLLQIGKYWTKLYLKSKPWAEIPDESCLREGCHEKRLLQGRVKFKKVIFDHKIHLTDLKRGKKLRCTSCHSQIVQGEHITVTESTCFICHFKKSEHYPRISDCSHCHEKKFLVSKEARFNHTSVFKNGFSCNKCHSYVVMGDGTVPRENCFKCHWEVDRLNKYDDTDLMHKTHISEHKIECLQCHLSIQHKIVRKIEALVDCQTCHPKHHQAQRILFSGEGGKGHLERIPNIMFEKGLSCKGCHIFHEDKGGKLIKGRTYISSPEACETCHGEGFSRILWEWEKATEKKLNKIKLIYKNISQKIKQSKNGDKEKIKKLLEDATFNIDIVEQGKGVHNVQYAEQLLSAAYNNLITALKEAGISYEPEKFIVKEEKIPSECATCHTGIEEISVNVYGSTFSHGRHILERDLKCSKCHSNVRQHGEFILSKKECAKCHHLNTKKECANCHNLQKKLYTGKIVDYKNATPDVMFDAGVECKDCHLNGQNQVIKPSKDKCLECHEEGYDEMMVEWQKTIKEKISKIKNLINKLKKSSIYIENRKLINKTKRELQTIEIEGSYGIHNYLMLDEYLSEKLKKLENLILKPKAN